MGCVDRSDSEYITSLAVCHGAAPFAARNIERSTCNSVYSVIKEQLRGDGYDNSRFRYDVGFHSVTPIRLVPLKICPSTIQYIFRAKRGGLQQIFFKIFFKLS